MGHDEHGEWRRASLGRSVRQWRAQQESFPAADAAAVEEEGRGKEGTGEGRVVMEGRGKQWEFECPCM